nr:MAG TPA: hypothetical protein [Caudoviricetes sp.]
MITASSNYLNPIEELKDRARQTNFAYREDTANKYAAQGQLYSYLYMIDKIGKTEEDYNKFTSNYDNFKFLNDEYKDFAMINEAQYKPRDLSDEELSKLSDDEKKLQKELTKKTLRTWTDDNGQQVSEEMTDYDWNKKLLNWKANEFIEEERKRQWEQTKKQYDTFGGFFVKLGLDTYGAFRHVVEGALDATNDLKNLIGGVIGVGQGIAENIAEGDIGNVDKRWREYMSQDDFKQLREAWEESAFDVERKVGIRDYYGNKRYFSNMVDGISSSFGRILPTMMMSWSGSKINAGGAKVSNASLSLTESAKMTTYMSRLANTNQVLFYASMANRDITEALSDPDKASLSSWEIFANAYAKAGVELLVEKGLNKVLGTTTIDSMTYGFNASSSTKLSGNKWSNFKASQSLVSKLAKEAFHEGLEEVLQDYSHGIVNEFFAAIDDALGNTENSNIFRNADEFNIQTAFDSFISGAVMSLIGGAFSYIKTKRIETAVPKADKEGNIIVDKKGEAKYQKWSKLRSWTFNEAMQSIDNNVNELLRSPKLSVAEKLDIVAGMNSSVQTMINIFDGMGAERFTKAINLLNIMSQVKNEENSKYINRLIEQGSKDIYKSVNEVFANYSIEKTTENFQRIIDNKLDNPIETVTRDTDLSERDNMLATERDTIKRILEECKDVDNIVITKNGTGAIITEDGKTIIVPEAQIENLSAEAITKGINERLVAFNLTKIPQFKFVIKEIFEKFKQLPINKNKKHFTQNEAILYLLMNEDFARTCLYTGDATIVEFVTQLGKLAKNMKVTDEFTLQHKNMLEQSVKVLSNLYMEYCIAMQYADINVDILSDEQRTKIVNERWNKDLANRINKGDKLTEADLRNLDNRVNSLTINEETKKQIITDLHGKDRVKRVQAFNKIAELQYGQFYSLFDDITYPKSHTMPNMTLYNFLRAQGITLQNLRNRQAYWREQFELYSDNVYSLEFENGNIKVVEKSPELRESKVTNKAYTEERRTLGDKRYYDTRSASTDFDKSILKSDVNEAYQDIVTINDIVTNPNLLNDDIRADIKKEYNTLSPEHIYDYLRYKFAKDSNYTKSIDVTTDGQFVMVDIRSLQDTKSEKADKKLSSISNEYLDIVDPENAPEDYKVDKEKLDKFFKKKYSISDFVNKKNLSRSDDAAVKVVVLPKSEAKGINGKYEVKTNTIYISEKLLTKSNESILYTILHEFEHAVQKHNNLSSGGTGNSIAQAPKADQKAILDDIKKHVDFSKVSNKNEVTQADLIIYYGTNETTADGYAYDPSLPYITFVSDFKKDGSWQVTAPWGSIYTFKNDGHIIIDKGTIKVQSKSEVKKSTEIEGDNYKSIKNKLKDEYGNNSYQVENFERDFKMLLPNENTKASKEKLIAKYLTLLNRYAKLGDIEVNDNNIIEAVSYLAQSKYWDALPESDLSPKSIDETTQQEDSQKYELSEFEYTKMIKDKRAAEKARAKAIKKSTVVSKKVHANDNLQYYAGRKMNANLQAIILATSGYEAKYSKTLINEIKEGRLQTVSDLYAFIRKNNLDDNTFSLLNKNYFKNTNITSSEQLDNLIKMSGQYYGIRAALRSIAMNLDLDVNYYLYNNLNAKILNKLLVELKEKAPQAFKLYQDVKNRYDSANYPIDFDSLKIAYLQGFDGTLDSAARIAAWARQLAYNPSLKRAGQLKTVSMEEKVRGTKGDNLTIGEKIANEFSSTIDFEEFPFGSDDVREMAREVYEDRLAVYLNSISDNKNLDRNSAEFKQILKERKMSMEQVLAEMEKIKNDVGSLTAEQVIEEYRSSELKEIFNVEVKYRANAQRNLTQKANRVKEALAGKKKAYQMLAEQYPGLGFTADKEWHMPTHADGSLLNIDEIGVLSDKLSEILIMARAGQFDPKVTNMKTKIGKQADIISDLRAKQKKLEADLKQTRQELTQTKRDYSKTRERIELDTTEFVMESTRRMPEKFKEVLDTVFTKLYKTKGKFTNVNEMHTVKSYKEWLDANYDILSSLDEIDANEIADYILHSTPTYAQYSSDDFTRYNAVSLFMLNYLYEARDIVNLNPNIVIEIEEARDNIASNAGTQMAIVRDLIKKVQPVQHVLAQLARSENLVIRQSDAYDLQRSIEKYGKTKDEKSKQLALQDVINTYNRMFRRTMESYKGNRRKFFDKAFSFQKMMMLSSPGTWIRNWTSNFIIEKTDAPMARLGQLLWSPISKIADLWDKRGKSKLIKPTFETKVSESVIDLAESRYNFNSTTTDVKEISSTITTVLNDRDKAYKIIEDNKDADKRTINRKKLDALILSEQDLMKARSNTIELNEQIRIDSRLFEIRKDIAMYSDPEAYARTATEIVEYLEDYSEYNRKLDIYNKKMNKNPTRRTLEGQYVLVGTKVDPETAAWVKSMVLDNGLFDMIKDGLNRYNLSESNKATLEGKITNLIVNSVMNKVFMQSQFDTKILNTISQELFKVLSDEKWINKTFISYLGKMLVESKVDLSQGYTNEVLDIIADAYTFAAYTYMHKSNFLTDLDKIMRNRLGSTAYFAYKQFFTFAGSSYNWFVEALDWTPIGLIKGIQRLANFENYLNKLDIISKKGQGPSARFASYMIKRELGKGMIGSAAMLFGLLLASFGLIKLEEDTYGNMQITAGSGDTRVTIDFGELYGTTGLGWGFVLGNAIYDINTDKNTYKDGMDILKGMLNNMFQDSIYTDLSDMFKYDSSIAEVLMNKPEKIAKSFIPNMLSTFNSLLYNHKVQYSAGFKGSLERWAAAAIPGLAYALPKQVDIYTGEVQYSYYPSFMGYISGTLSKFGAIKIKPRKISDMEKLAMAYGVKKKQLKGDYKDIGKFNSVQKAKLNQVYGQLNKKALDDLVNNKTKYTIQDKKTGKYADKYYKDMTDDEKGTVISRIMTKNSSYAKIYIWTSEGHKYYCSNSEYLELAKLGIMNNFYKGSSKQLVAPFVK